MRLILVFWLSIVAGLVAFLIAVEIHYLAEVMPLLSLLHGLDIDANGQGLFVLLLFTFLKLFFLIFLLNWLCCIATWQNWLWILVFISRARGVFVFGALGLQLKKNIVGQAMALGTTSI